jgi:hypothetical protein
MGMVMVRESSARRKPSIELQVEAGTCKGLAGTLPSQDVLAQRLFVGQSGLAVEIPACDLLAVDVVVERAAGDVAVVGHGDPG